MTDTNWPNPDRPGVPMFPERKGLHVLVTPSGHHVLMAWEPEENIYKSILGAKWDMGIAGNCTYYGPVLTPTQLTELLAGEREKCAREAESHRSKANPHAVAEWDVVQSSTANAIAHAIRNLGDAT